MFRIQNPMQPLYEETHLSEEDRHSLNTILTSNICGGMFGIVCQPSTSAMVGLVTELGANDLVFGILTAIPQATCLMQLPFSLLMKRKGKQKPYVVGFGVAARFIWILIGMMPMFFPEQKTLALGLVLALLAISSVLICALSVGWFSMFSDITPDGIRSRWISIREMLSSIFSFAFGLLVAYVLDHVEGTLKYTIVFTVAGVLGVIDAALFHNVREVKHEADSGMPLRLILKKILRNKPFMRFTLMWMVWCFTCNMYSPYLTPYSMNVMGLNFTQITLFGTMASAVSTAIAMPRWGRLLTRMPSTKVMLISCLANTVLPFVYLLSSKGNILPTLLYNLIGALAWSGANLSASYMQLEFSTQDIRPTYLAVFNMITAICGTTLGSLTGGFLLEAWEAGGVHIGFMDRYMMLFVLGAILRLIGVVLLVPRIAKTVEAEKARGTALQ